jgi:FkbM family methyltransferase
MRLGSPAGGWRALEDTPAGAVCYCGGDGLDATFDFELARRFGAEVHSFDPTPHAIAYMEAHNDAGVTFHPWGLLDRDATIRFHAPISSDHQSFFVENLHDTSDFFEAPCCRIGTIMRKLGHDRIHLLKIDIEGSWYPVVADMIEAGIRPDVIDVEFDSPAPIWRVRRITRLLQRAGYAAVDQEKDNVVFLRMP